MANKKGRPVGSGNPFQKGNDDVHGIVRDFYGPSAYKIAAIRKEHINKGCHTCMKEAEDRLYGRPPQEIKNTGLRQPPLILMFPPGTPAPQLQETAIEAEVLSSVEEVDEVQDLNS